MTKVLFGILLFCSLAFPASAAELTAPEVPPSGQALMPRNRDSLAEGLWELLQKGLKQLQPELTEAASLSTAILACAMLYSILGLFREKLRTPGTLAGAASIAAMILRHTGTMVGYASETVRQIGEYGKLLCPVLTTALAAQGGVTASAALYTGTVAFNALLNQLMTRWLIPLIFLYLAFSIANCAFPEEALKKFSDAIKNTLHWLLKTLLMVFTTYLSVTGVVTGATDAAALKAAKLTVSTVVPVVGGILSDASESVLVSMDVMKNAAGIYGILALLAIFLGPFLKVGVQYLMLKVTSLLCSLFAGKPLAALVEDFSTAMGFLLAMVAVSCVLFLVSTVCYLKGLG